MKPFVDTAVVAFSLFSSVAVLVNAQDTNNASDPLYTIPEGGWEFGNCQIHPYAEEDAQSRGSEDIDDYKDNLYFVSAGMHGPDGGDTLRNTTDAYTDGGIYVLDLSEDAAEEESIVFQRAAMTGLPQGLNFRPHGIYYDANSNRLLVVSHNEQVKEENIVIFTIQDSSDSSMPTLVFQVALYSDQWVPVGNNIENWHLNDIVVAGADEFLTTQWGLFDLENPQPKMLWSCALEATYSNVPDDGRVKTTCVSALDVFSIGLNGITIKEDTRDTAWVSDLLAAQLLEIRKNPDIPGNWTLTGTIPTIGLVDNLNYIDGVLHMASPLKILDPRPENWIGSYLVGTHGGSDSDMFTVEPVFQMNTTFLEELDIPFGMSGVYPAGNLLILGAVEYPGIAICSKLPSDNAVIPFGSLAALAAISVAMMIAV